MALQTPPTTDATQYSDHHGVECLCVKFLTDDFTVICPDNTSDECNAVRDHLVTRLLPASLSISQAAAKRILIIKAKCGGYNAPLVWIQMWSETFKTKRGFDGKQQGVNQMTVENIKVSFFDRPNVEKGMINVGQG
ncbi:MAG TPA: hypothetical protein VK900_14810, partial [Anaerolineales bacterium]|nr:hypothetical protein [Anaerolineales bacterium]